MIAGGFLLGALAGFLMHRSDYCVAGMFRDLFLFRATRMLKTLLLLITVSLPLFELIRLTGFVSVPFPFFGPPSLTNLLGGFLFGIGMVLAGGCVVGTLYRLGAGSFPGLLAFLGLVAGSMLFACLYPQWTHVSRALALPTKAVTLPQLLGLPPWLFVSLLVPVLIVLIWRWFRDGSMYRTGVVDGYLQPWQAALGLALIGAASVVLVGMPMGITTSYSKFGAMLLEPLASEYYASINYFQLVPLRYTPPLGGA
nr:YeeE/YedE thiosulfate transporter family protein [Trichlorobacter sp.]